jgi:hypothetical protein
LAVVAFGRDAPPEDVTTLHVAPSNTFIVAGVVDVSSQIMPTCVFPGAALPMYAGYDGATIGIEVVGLLSAKLIITPQLPFH